MPSEDQRSVHLDVLSVTHTVRARIEALVEGLSSPADFLSSSERSSNMSLPSSSSSPDPNLQIPPILSVAGPSTAPRAQDKVVIITGANSPLGIGRASAHLFAAHGARAIYITDADDTYLAAHQKELNAKYPSVEIHPALLDVTDESAVKAICDDAVSRYGRLDVMFANAGTSGGMASFADIEADDFMDILKVNTLGVFLCFKHAALAMKKTSSTKSHSGGSLIGTASVAGLRSNAGGTAYSASKAAVVNIAQTFAYQLVGTNIRANAICPGLIETGMTSLVFELARKKGTQGKIGQLNPLRRAAVADEVARVALFLGSDESSYVNGQAWAVCGGLSAGLPFVPGKLA